MRPRVVLRALEAALLRGLLRLLGLLSATAASNLGGAVARAIGPALPVSRVAEANLRLAMPGLDAAARRRIVRGVWENLGRTVAELPHLPAMCLQAGRAGYEVVGAEELLRLAAAGEPAVVFSGHLANWELLIPVAAAHGIRIGLIYRAPSNPAADAVLRELRRAAMRHDVPMFPKGAEGARGALAHLRGGGVLGLLIDQKMNDGIAAPLFGHAAMTAPAGASLALRFRCRVIPVHAERLGPARYRVVVEPSLPLPDSGNRTADVATLTAAMNASLERWIRDRPAEWLWLHRRWPNRVYT